VVNYRNYKKQNSSKEEQGFYRGGELESVSGGRKEETQREIPVKRKP
jgi:hypothetical protein